MTPKWKLDDAENGYVPNGVDQDVAIVNFNLAELTDQDDVCGPLLQTNSTIDPTVKSHEFNSNANNSNRPDRVVNNKNLTMNTISGAAGQSTFRLKPIGKTVIIRFSSREVCLISACLLLSVLCVVSVLLMFSYENRCSVASNNQLDVLIQKLAGNTEYAVDKPAILHALKSVLREARDWDGHAPRPICLTKECVRTAASLMSAMNLTADPCEDFFQFACGTWNKRHVIPEDRSSISTFEVLSDHLQVLLKDVLEEQINLDSDNSATIKAKTFYKTCMDTYQIRKHGDIPLRRVLALLGGWPVTNVSWTPPPFSLETLLGRLRGEYDEGILVEEWVGPDDKNSSVNIIQLDQMQLALPSRDYYVKPSSQGEMDAYHKFMVQVAMLLGANETTAPAELKKIVDFEISLADVTLPEADRHDTSTIYRKISIAELQLEVPELNWLEYFQGLVSSTGGNITKDEQVVVYAMDYFKQMGKIVGTTDRRVIHNYVLWRLIMEIVPYMIGEYQQVRIEFRKILLGILTDRNRWAQCVEITNKKLGMAVGALFIRNNFDYNSKITALQMIRNIREAFNELLGDNAWMDDETRKVAKEKADAMKERIGYPDSLTNKKELEEEYRSLNVTNDEFLVNVFHVLRYDAQENLRKLRRPVDKNRWDTEPAVVNAFYNPNKNNIVFPAGILQPLFYSKHFPKSLNYGGIGVVIGHEITHGFDDKGRQFDKDGNMKQWWNNATIKAFRQRAQCIIEQYSKFRIEEIGLNVNGRMTQGENIADNGGLKQAFRAFKKWVSIHGYEPDLPGMNMTHDQLFFLNYAQIWCGSMRPEDALTKIRSSVHSPGLVRVMGPLANSYDFAKAYNCPTGSPMNPMKKCSVW